ncbi:hypothetical protein [Streptomyces daghestanicus]|uniref:Uncharacterized protein n=1 Tax=Streptomyces daghestanicus TaxID=66885 RepID=A0ABQ3PVT0_9ACTN|nr:hypothetical protein [Streptomyces daghestanicus]GGU52742.1 hypothetical protein GCM10010259_49910 [Streptomyces daghestanicus]GHI29130.1 hypothetical protein Sdagh_08600 [Streptomyces daghestanicus]
MAASPRAPGVRLAGLVDLAERERVRSTPDGALAGLLERARADARPRPRIAVGTEQAPSAIGYAAA